MKRHPIRARLGALSVTIGLVAGCSPNLGMAPLPGGIGSAPPSAAPSTAPAAGASAPAAAATAAPGASATPASPGPTARPGASTPAPAVRSLDFEVKFRDAEPQVGFTVQAFDALTGEPVERRKDLAGATGLAILDEGLVTDAAGRVTVKVAGFSDDQVLRFAFVKGKTVFETMVAGDGTSLATPPKAAFVLQQAGDTVLVTASTTAAAQIGRDYMRLAAFTNPRERRNHTVKLIGVLAQLNNNLASFLQQDQAYAIKVVLGSSSLTIFDEATRKTLEQLAARAEVTRSLMQAVADIAKAIHAYSSERPEASQRRMEEAITRLAFIGTPLSLKLEPTKGTLQVTNAYGGTVDAGGDLSVVTSRSRPSGGSGGGGSSNNTPSTSRTVTTLAELQAAIADTAVTRIVLGADITAVANLSVNRVVTIDGEQNELNLTSMAVSAAATIEDFAALPTTTLEVAGTTLRGSTIRALTVAGNSSEIRNCTITGVTLCDPVYAPTPTGQALSGVTFGECTFTDGIEATDVINLTIDTCQINGASRLTSNTLASSNVTVTGGRLTSGFEVTGDVDDTTFSATRIEGAGRLLLSAPGTTVTNCTFAAREDDRLVVVNASDTTIRDSVFELPDANNGEQPNYIQVAETGAAAITNVLIDGNTFRLGDRTITVDLDQAGSRVTLTDNRFENCGEAMRLGAPAEAGLTVTGNTFIRGASQGIAIIFDIDAHADANARDAYEATLAAANDIDVTDDETSTERWDSEVAGILFQNRAD